MSLASLQASLNNKRAQLQQKNAEKQDYLDTAAHIKKLYDRMKADKQTMKDHKANLKTFSKENYTEFKGNLFQNIYKPKLTDVLSGYDDVISRIDYNLDGLNNMRTKYENKASSCNGPIGILTSGINLLVTQIQNWTN